MEGWKSGVGLQKPPPRPQKAARASPKTRRRAPSRSKEASGVSSSKKIAAQIEVAKAKMTECVKAQDYAGAGKFQSEVKELEVNLENMRKEEKRKAEEQQKRRQEEKRRKEKEKRKREQEDKRRREEERRRKKQEEEETRRRAQKKPSVEDLVSDTLKKIKAAMVPHIKAKQYKLCIPLRSDYKRIEVLHKRFQMENDADEWRTTFEKIQELSNSY